MKIALLSSYPAELLKRESAGLLKKRGILTEWYVDRFENCLEALVRSDSSLHLFKPDAIFIYPPHEYSYDSRDIILRTVECAIESFPFNMIFVPNIFSSRRQPLRTVQWNLDKNVSIALQVNQSLATLAEKKTNISLLDLEWIAASVGYDHFFDDRFHYLHGSSLSSLGLRKTAEQLSEALVAFAGKRKKCLVLDADNTLWGGILEEEGIDGVALGSEGIGRAFYDFQKSIAHIHESGVILALCSKNNEETILKMFRTHPSMVLREDMFSSMKVNWRQKTENICEIAADLNIGTDSIVFIDDSPIERECVKSLLPEIFVPDLPDDPALYPLFLSKLSCFNTFTITEEDKNRNRFLIDERMRKEGMSQAASLRDFFSSLRMKVDIQKVDAFTRSRVMQLFQKVNQFNISSKQYSETEVNRFIEDPNCDVLCASASDVFGDTGIIGACVLLKDKNIAILDSLVVSCRVLGRGVEEAIIQAIMKQFHFDGYDTMITSFYSTDKNGVARVFLEKYFDFLGEGKFSINTERIIAPDYISTTLYG